MYFAVNVLAKLTNNAERRTTVREFRNAVKLDVEIKKTPRHQVKAFLFDLIERSLIEIFDKDGIALEIRETQTDTEDPDLTDEVVTTGEFVRAAKKYVEHAFPRIKPADPDRADSYMHAMTEIYAFMVGKYKPIWEDYLRELSRLPNAKRYSVEGIYGKLIESTEYYVIIHTMMECILDGHEGDCDLDFLHVRSTGTRRIELSEFEDAIRWLVTSCKIFVEGTDKRRPHYQFSPVAWEMTEAYLAKLRDVSRDLDDATHEIAIGVA